MKSIFAKKKKPQKIMIVEAPKEKRAAEDALEVREALVVMPRLEIREPYAVAEAEAWARADPEAWADLEDF